MPPDNPDALLWRADNASHYLCAHCAAGEARTAGDTMLAAYRAATAHLWRSHSLHRVWLIEQRPELEVATQMALDCLLPHNTQFDRAT